MNGQRETSNNVTIDGVANIDTGDNGGNMAVTNTEAISEFKVLTSSYQAEYGRAVGGQVQMVTKSGTQSFHGSGYWFGRRSGWNANSWTNNRAGAPAPVGNGAVIEPPKASRDDFGFTIGGPIYIPGVFNTDKKKLFFFWSEEFQKRSSPPSQRTARVPTALERAGDFSQSVDNSGNPYPYIRDYTTGLPCNASDTRGCFQDGGVLGRIPAEPPLCSRPRRAEPLPPAELHVRRRRQLHEPGLGQLVTAFGPDPAGLPAQRQLARHRPLHADQERHDPGVRHPLGRQRQLPGSDGSALQEPRLQLDAEHQRHPQQHDLARGERRDRAQLARLRDAGPAAVPGELGAQQLPLPLSGRRPGRLRPALPVRRHEHREARPSTRRTAARSATSTRPGTWSRT